MRARPTELTRQGLELVALGRDRSEGHLRSGRASDGYRVLIDRLWPRGLARAGQPRRVWERELPSSTELRQWFGHEPGRIEELRSGRPRIAELRRRAREDTLTLVYSARDTEHNDAVVLAEILRRGLPRAGRQR